MVEIQPETFTSTWLRDLTALVGVEWNGYFCPSPIAAKEAAWTYRIRRGFRWAYWLPLEDFLAFLVEVHSTRGSPFPAGSTSSRRISPVSGMRREAADTPLRDDRLPRAC